MPSLRSALGQQSKSIAFALLTLGLFLGPLTAWADNPLRAPVPEQRPVGALISPSAPVLSSHLVYLPFVLTSPEGPNWPMAGANPQRTGWTPEALPGDIRTVWAKPIVPYVSQHIQVIGAANKVFVSTAAGLYAFDAETGAVAWVYPTELPLGHSPTFSNGVLFVGGMDRRLHAVAAATGQGIWTFEAEGGFYTNPVVVNGTVYAGNRDGALYAINANSGQQVWKYQTGNQILQSPAYQDGRTVFCLKRRVCICAQCPKRQPCLAVRE